ncbi:hypothetical protein M0813_20207 [Anaeramoeba flamelloides]|uniref:Uncharacterized protein n=1 Tax=Anaeramoeba flamelloides TaxID=1746091 RepID=A0ABQ8YMM4_9EUKA|nr:hypothetical protein M0813_20207 [Anaeramoeba flamelloides]
MGGKLSSESEISVYNTLFDQTNPFQKEISSLLCRKYSSNKCEENCNKKKNKKKGCCKNKKNRKRKTKPAPKQKTKEEPKPITNKTEKLQDNNKDVTKPITKQETTKNEDIKIFPVLEKKEQDNNDLDDWFTDEEPDSIDSEYKDDFDQISSDSHFSDFDEL